MTSTDPCELCQTPATPIGLGGRDAICQDCPRCGRFILSGTAMSMVRHRRKSRALLSFWVYEQNDLGSVPEITSYTIKMIEAMPPLPIAERANRMLLAATRIAGGLGVLFDLSSPKLQLATHSMEASDVEFFTRMLQDEGLLRRGGSAGEAAITPKGYMRAEALSSQRTASLQGFVAMWFDAGMRTVYDEAIDPAIRAAGYEPRRIDDVEHADKVDDRIVAEIRRSRFVVADFTGHRGGVYYEAGFAQGLGLPVIWTCRKDELERLHFDIRQYNCIDWSGPGDLLQRLQARIEAVLGDGPLKLATRTDQ